MKMLFKKLVGLFIDPESGQSPQSNPDSSSKPHIIKLTIEDGMTVQEFTQRVADCFVGVDCPEKFRGEGAKIFTAPQTNLARIRWEEINYAMTFVTTYGQRGYGIALIQLRQPAYDFLSLAYRHIGQDGFVAFIGEHELDMTPVKTIFPLAS